ncbi:MAG: sulfotransferase family 2 domain-containing protein [Myxococcota bacterium]
MAILCRDLKMLFVLTPATGSTALSRVLCSDFGGVWLPEKSGGPVRRKHSTLTELLEAGLLSSQERDGLCVVTSVRNPYDRLVSIYYKRRGVTSEALANPDFWMNRLNAAKASADLRLAQNNTFPEWIRHRFIRSWLPRRLRGRALSAYDQYVDGADVVLRYERLQEDFDDVLVRLGAAPAEIPQFNVSKARPRRDYQKEYTTLSRAMAGFGQRLDLNRFGYEF